MKFTSGQFNKLGKVYRISESVTPDASGHVNEANESNWRLVGPRHFCIAQASSKEVLVGDQLNASVSHTITTTYDRQSKSFDEKFKFVYQGRQFNFSGPGINVEERNRWISFPAQEM